ncbi:MAG TPA: cation-translocating P-type ATPase [Candidatus Pseudogracilibacillus intestinigallinarum]|uniref:Cd(2+)-exporting ATPase n=1 Tax=Candidatus Pseudogracilibacillus intestinigallinarum TaxID=2838742 RepID=A0A9D1PNU9_9BACI|nr:cation-translocating P-type ATPase [Candidatus Pseudogracilibacillus intestinigallinarum]
MKKIQLVWISGLLLLLALICHIFDFTLWKNNALLLATIIAGATTAKTAFQAVRMKAFSIELLVTIAVIGALFIGEYVEAAAVTFLFLFGSYLEARSLEKTRASLQTLLDMSPLEATVIKDGEKTILPIEEIHEGDILAIQSGEKVAVDGKIISGQASMNEATITGESVPKNKTTEDYVFSGTIIDQGYIEIIAEKVGDDTTFAKIIELVEEAQETKAKTQKFLEKFANIYTPSIILLSLFVLIFTKNIELTLTFLVIACPGALVISAPVSLVAGIGNGARKGTLIKGGEVMENLAKVDVVVFDKTGTLTEGKPSITNIQTYGIEENTLLKIAAEAEIISEHHLGRTIVQEAKIRHIPLEKEPSHFDIVKGHGLHALLDGQHVVIGNRQLLRDQQININTPMENDAVQLEKAGNTVIFVAIDKTVKGIISIKDKVKLEAKTAIERLKHYGIKQTIMLTGDNQHTAEQVATQLHIDTVHAEMLPEDKVLFVKQLKEKGYRVAMVGDGINDAPALALADVGLAMGIAGTDVAMETADVVLMNDQLQAIPSAISLAKATVKNMQQNMFFAVGTVILLLIGVLLGKVFLASGMLIHELSVLAVVLNALRLIRFNDKRNKHIHTAPPIIEVQSNE